MSGSPFDNALRKFRAETIWLGTEFLNAASIARTRQTQLACEMSVIRLHDSWARFCRELVITSALGGFVTFGGTRLPRSITPIVNRRSAITTLLARKRWRYEPKWATSALAIDAALALSVSNLTTISAAISAVNSPANELRLIRNYFAHRGEDTSSQALTTGRFGTSPSVFDLSQYIAGGNTVFEDWIQRFEAIAVAAMQ